MNFSKAAMLCAGFTFLFTGCAVGPDTSSVVELPVPEGDGQISVSFEDFVPGTACTVQMTDLELTLKVLQGELVYPSSQRSSKIFCDAPDGSRYSVDVESSLPRKFRFAGITASRNGSLFATISTKGGLVRAQDIRAVKKVE